MRERERERLSTEKKQQHHRTFRCIGCVPPQMFSSGWWPAQMVQWTKLLLISLVIDSILFYFFFKRKQRKKWRKKAVISLLFGWLFSLFYLTDHIGNGMNMAILHVFPSNIYKTVRWKLWRSDVLQFCVCVFQFV